MIPKYPDTDRIDSISAELAQRFAVLYDKIATLTDENELLRSTVTDCRIEIELLTAERDKAREERDEARREVLMNEANHLPTMSDPFREAKRRGWDCLESRRPWDCHKDYK